MTREEIIDELCRLRSDIVNSGGYVNRTNKEKEKFAQALSDVIKDLQTEQLKESPENFNKDFATESMLNADLISRQAAIDTAIEAADKWDGGFSVERSRIITEALNELPSVQPTQKVGKWGRKIVDGGYNADWICSSCGYKEMTDFPTKFCPNCGAKMEEGDAE